MAQVEQGIGGAELLAQVGDHVCRNEKAEACLGKEAQRAVVAVEHGCVELPPVGLTGECAYFLIRFATVETPLQETVAGVRIAAEGFLDLPNDLLRR